MSIQRHLARVLAVSLLASPLHAAEPKPEATSDAKEKPAETKPKGTPLFDGKSLEGWKVSKFGGDGPVDVKDGTIVIGAGVDLTGIRTERKLPTMNYQVDVDAQRVNGNDFFCGLTFPVKDKPCSLIIGGWGGGVCGLSSIDGLDASENGTTTYRGFKKGQWYHIRLRVSDKRIQAWIDDERIVDQDIVDRKISIRSEVELSKPFGFATWMTTAALKNIVVRPLTKAELAAIEKEAAEDE